ncbi:MAG: hypothetical protein B7Y74_06220 [Novosphingobium sp. 35-62-5]|nr:MAG: hypothetical protein B7Y74_06220 [Novosphingobium sp. 35-62-5]
MRKEQTVRCAEMAKPAIFPVAILAAVHATSGQAKEVLLEPSSQWHVIYDADNCRLARMFGADKDTVLTFQQPAPDNILRVSVYGPPFKSMVTGTNDVMVAFGNGQKLVPAKHSLPGFAGDDKQPLLMLGPLDLLNRDFSGDEELTPELAPTREQVAGIDRFTVAKSGKRVALHTGSMSKALDVLAICTRDLVKSWGLDPDQQAKLSARPKYLSKPSSWLQSNDYPVAALRMGKSASIQFRLMVDKAGVPTACSVQSATQSPEFIDLTCKLLMKRARFAPALDAQGQPVGSYYINSVNWVMRRP